MQNIESPVKIKDIDKFEIQNEISVNVYGLDNDVVFPMHITTQSKPHHVDLLYISNDETQHYVLIKNMSRLVSSKITNHHGHLFFCKFCLHGCESQRILDKHLEKCQLHGAQRIKMPEVGKEKLY